MSEITMNNPTPKPRKLCNKKAKEWLDGLYGKNLAEKESEEAIINLVNYFKTLKEIADRKATLDAANQTRHTKSNVVVK